MRLRSHTKPTLAAKRALALPSFALLALALGACGSTVSTSGFKGEQHEAVQAISNLQSDATAADQKKICADDLAAAIVTKLNKLGGAGGCEAAIKNQLAEVDSLEVNIQSVKITGASASASVTSIYSGKKRLHSVSLVKEGGKWKVSGLQ
jgi:copper chaperone CopZ